jgi:hypothetical protein
LFILAVGEEEEGKVRRKGLGHNLFSSFGYENQSGLAGNETHLDSQRTRLEGYFLGVCWGASGEGSSKDQQRRKLLQMHPYLACSHPSFSCWSYPCPPDLPSLIS